MNSIVQQLLAGERRQTGQADMILEAAGWAAASYAAFDRARVDAIARAAAEAGHAVAGVLAEAAVKETGFGVAAHKKIKNELTSRGLYELYRGEDFCSPRVLPERKMVELPRPAGVIFGLTPSTNPVCTVFFKILLALMTRNAIVVSPHPKAKVCSAEAARVMAQAAEKAGAPAGLVQVIDEPTLPLIDHLMKSPKVNVILATGGTPMVRAAYSSGNPAIGVGPGNAPVLVDATADVDLAAKRIVESKSFDNSILCTNESVVVAEEPIADKLLASLRSAGAYVARPEEVGQLRELLFGLGSFNVDMLGKSAGEIGQAAGIRVPANARIIVAEIDRVGIDEPLSREKLCPVLGFVRAEHADAAITISRALIRLSGAGHSAAIHSHDPRTILKYGATVKALRVAVNAPCSQGAAGFSTHLAPSFTIGTGFFGRSAIGENIEPRHLVNWTRIAYNEEAGEAFDSFDGLALSFPESTILGREAPISLGVLQEGAERHRPAATGGDEAKALREEIRRMVLEELRHALRK
ncbi:MAG TPA: aldehyde dehydrogenase family protein [Dongiaceae bacterium]|jgi:acyl-CoA reductase-like NAD-dependent aldehyde dehydrogenase|nr:aldehyde dehydrogenase family protein [Dongiaceae bacterium]